MAKNSDPWAGAFETEKTGILSGLLAEENELDRRTLWRIGSWGVAAIIAVVSAVWANQATLSLRRDQLAAAELVRQAQQMQSLAKESQNETRRLAAAIDTLNGDRDRLYARVTVVEQGLDSVTGAVARQTASPPPPQAAAKAPAPAEPPPTQPQAAAPSVSPVASAPATQAEKPREKTASAEQGPPPASSAPPPAANAQAAAPQSATAASLVAAKSLLAPPDPAAAKLFEPARPGRVKTEAKTDPRSEPVIASQPIAPAKEPGKEVASNEAPGKDAAPKDVAAKDTAAKDVAKDVAPKETAATEIAAKDLTGKESAAKEVVKEAAKEQDDAEAALPKVPVPRTEFAVDLGTANSIGGLRALWRGLSKSSPELAALRPIIMIRESHTGLGMQLRLAAGPLSDAAAAAKICAALGESDRGCETTVFDGQRLALKEDETAPSAVKPSPPHKRGYYSRRTKKDDPQPQPAKPESSTLSRLLGKP